MRTARLFVLVLVWGFPGVGLAIRERRARLTRNDRIEFRAFGPVPTCLGDLPNVASQNRGIGDHKQCAANQDSSSRLRWPSWYFVHWSLTTAADTAYDWRQKIALPRIDNRFAPDILPLPMSPATIASIDDVRAAETVIRKYLSPVPLIRSYALEKEIGLPAGRRVWIKDYGWTPVGSFKLFGALNWMANQFDQIGDRPVAAHSSGNFASGLAFAGMTFDKRVIIVMPSSAPQVKFARTRAFGADVRTYDISRDHETGDRDRLTREIAETENAIQASPYDDNHVIAGNGVGGLGIVGELASQGRKLSHFFCGVSGGGLMAGHALAIADRFPDAKIIGVEPTGADDFARSLAAGKRVRVDQPESICDGLLSYDVGEHNWPILRDLVTEVTSMTDAQTCAAMKWIDTQHGLRTEPSGVITVAALTSGKIDLDGDGDIVVVLSGRNVDSEDFQRWTA